MPPLLLDTDLGTNVDDAFALALCLACPEINLRGISLAGGENAVRYRFAREFLNVAGQPDLPIAGGAELPRTPHRPRCWTGHEERGLPGSSDLAPLPDGLPTVPELLTRLAGEAGGLTLCAIGPLTNLALALAADPDIQRLLRGVVVMGGVFGWDPAADLPPLDHNMAADPDAARTVLDSGLPLVLVPLDVTWPTAIHRRELAALERSSLPHLRALADMASDYMDLMGRDSTRLHDPLAVAVAAGMDGITMEQYRLTMDRRGRLRGAPDGGGNMRVVTRVDHAVFRAWWRHHLSLDPSA